MAKKKSEDITSISMWLGTITPILGGMWDGAAVVGILYIGSLYWPYVSGFFK